MNTCFQKQVGKRKKTEDDENESDQRAAMNSPSEELVIIEDDSENGRTGRLNKRRKKQEDKELEIAINILQNEFDIPVDDSMSRNEIIDLAHALFKSKQDEGLTPSQGRSSQPRVSQPTQPSTSASKSAQPSTASVEYDASGFKAESKTVKTSKSHNAEISSKLSTADSSKSKRRISRHEETREVTEIDSSPSESGDAVYETEEPIPRNTGRETSDQRKRQLDKSEGQSSQESDESVPQSKKSRNLQLNRKQLETMHAKTSTLLKRSTARLSHETQAVSGSKKDPDKSKMADSILDDEETQDPGSQELFAGETIPLEPDEIPSDEAEAPSQPRATPKPPLVPAKFMEVLWPDHIPMKRTAFSRSSIKQKKAKSDLPLATLFAPEHRDPIKYSKVILQLFNLYFRKLSKEQTKIHPCMAWGESVKPGRHMSRTVDLKGRGQDSYPWSSESGDEKSSDDGNKSGSGRLKSRKGGWISKTKTKRLLRSKSNENNSDSDFVSESKRIQPRRLVTPRPPIHRQRSDDEDDLPDLGISAMNRNTEDSVNTAAKQPLSQVYPTFIEQTLAMEEPLYMGDTETFEPEIEGKTEQNEIQPRKRIQRGHSPVLDLDETSKDSDILPESNSTSTSKKIKIHPGPSQESRDSESGSILDSQGELKSFQKVRKGTFNFGLEDDVETEIDNLLKDDVKGSQNSQSKTATTLSSSGGSDLPREDVGRDAEKENDENGHVSPVLGYSKVNTKRKKVHTISVGDSEDDFLSIKNCNPVKRKGLSVFDVDSDDDPRPSTSKERIIPVMLKTYERKHTAVKPMSRKKKPSQEEIEDIEVIPCPMCSRLFGKDVIQQHASDCVGQQEVTSTTGDDDTASGERTNDKTGTRLKNRGENSRRLGPDGDEFREQFVRRVKPVNVTVTPSIKSLEQCIICHKLIPEDKIELHTDNCISAKMRQSEEAQFGAGAWEQKETKKPRETRSRTKGKPDQPRSPQNKSPDDVDIESVSSEASNDQDQDWSEVNEKSKTDPKSPLKFKKISQLEDSVMDFTNQFKSKQTAKRGAKRGGCGKK